MIIKHLGHIGFDKIMECFLLAFDDYFVKMPTDYNYYKLRWKAAKVNFELSYGMFDDDKLVGFIIHAIDKRDGDLTAFNTGTGVIPEYRGKKIVKSIYKYAIPDLAKNGITKSVLEVIIENEKAIKAYKGVGFKVRKNFKCYSGELSINLIHNEIEEVSFNNIAWEQIPNQNKYSWDFNYESLKKSEGGLALRNEGRLPFADDEVLTISNFFGGTTWLNENATRENFFKNVIFLNKKILKFLIKCLNIVLSRK